MTVDLPQYEEGVNLFELFSYADSGAHIEILVIEELLAN